MSLLFLAGRPRRCSLYPSAPAAARQRRLTRCIGRGTIGPMNGAIDVHTHILPPRWDDWAARFGGKNWPRLVGDPTTQCQLYLGETLNRNLGPDSFDPVRRIADMDKTGIAWQLLSPPPPLFCYSADGLAAAEFCRMQNDNIAAVVARHPDRFLGAGPARPRPAVVSAAVGRRPGVVSVGERGRRRRVRVRVAPRRVPPPPRPSPSSPITRSRARWWWT